MNLINPVILFTVESEGRSPTDNRKAVTDTKAYLTEAGTSYKLLTYACRNQKSNYSYVEHTAFLLLDGDRERETVRYLCDKYDKATFVSIDSNRYACVEWWEYDNLLSQTPTSQGYGILLGIDADEAKNKPSYFYDYELDSYYSIGG